MILRTERPYNLETPQKYFTEDFTPNDVFFVRWHLSQMPDKIDTDTFRLRVTGHVKQILTLSLKDLKNDFTPITMPALAVCAGNSRQQFEPGVPGVQWKNGAMGNARWTGIPLKAILEKAGIKDGALEVAFNGLDDPPLSKTPDFIKTLPIGRALDGEVLVAFEMNGDTIPLLNGAPLKLIVPGWYATYWVGMLNEIRVYKDTFKGFWMQKAYLVPKNVRNGNESPDSLAKITEPIRRIAIRSIFVKPEGGSTLNEGESIEVQGLAFEGGDGISKVELSTDSGTTWQLARLDGELGKYAWRRWRFNWIPEKTGMNHLMVKATSRSGESQPVTQWNRSGYMKNEIEMLSVFVTEK
ncbi:MAG: molybdopterin-dependent oxidoreductase, partial [Bacteroidota bacterium]